MLKTCCYVLSVCPCMPVNYGTNFLILLFVVFVFASFRILHNLPICVSARISLVNNNLLTFDELLLKNYYSFINHFFKSSNTVLGLEG